MYKNARELYSKLISIYYDDYNDITDEEKKRMSKKCDPKNLVIKGQRFNEEKSESRSERTIAERVKLRKQKKSDDKDLTARHH